MEYLSIPVRLFRSAEYIGAEPVVRATWLALLGWCCQQENGGVIEGCAPWGDRRWMQTCGVTEEEVWLESELYWWEGDNLVVMGYPTEIQETLEARRDLARANGKKGGRPKKADSETDQKPTSVSEKKLEKTNVGFSEKPTSVFEKNLEETNIESVSKVSNSNRGEKHCTVDNTPANVEPTDSFPPPVVDAAGLRRLAEAVNSLRPAWKISRFSQLEKSALRNMWQTLSNHELGTETADVVRRYLASAPAGASKWDFPPDRALFLEIFSEVIAKAYAWEKAQRPGVTPKKSTGGVIAGKLDAMTEEEQAGYLEEIRELQTTIHA